MAMFNLFASCVNGTTCRVMLDRFVFFDDIHFNLWTEKFDSSLEFANIAACTFPGFKALLWHQLYSIL
jgi:hypothetical protein